MTTLDRTVTEDAFELDDDSGYNAGATVIRADSSATDSSRRNGGFYFPNITVPKNSTIDVSHVTIRCVNTGNDDANLDISAEDVDDADDFTTTADVTGRLASKTTASAAWVADSLGTSTVNSPSIVSVIQEIVDRSGWSSGNAIVMLFEGRDDTLKNIRMEALEHSGTDPAILHIEYTAAAAGQPVPIRTQGVPTARRDRPGSWN